ncbi:MAG: hypothetical protein R6U96_12245 [Promethearchaeia archaeon]
MMFLNIFHLNWILIDSIIIIFLILVLTIVKIYKYMARWRTSFSNEHLSVHYLEQPSQKGQKSLLKTIQFVQNKISITRKSPVLVVLSKNKRKRLEYALVEALGTYGYSILWLVLKKHSLSSPPFPKEEKKLAQNIDGYFDHLISQEYISDRNFIVVDFFTLTFLSESLSSSQFYQGTVSINPPLNSEYKSILQQHGTFQSPLGQLNFILSFYSFFFLKNSTFNFLLNFKKENDIQQLPLGILGSARRSFKNYESLLLIKIIKIIDEYSLPQTDVERKNSQKL